MTPEPEGGSGGNNLAQAPEKIEIASVNEWLNSMSGQGTIRVKVERLDPKMFRGKRVGGILGWLDEMVDEDHIRERWGGGKFRVMAYRHSGPTNKLVMAGTRTIEIAGDPRITGDIFEEGGQGTAAVTPVIPNAGEEPISLQRHVLSMAERIATEERDRARQIEQESRSTTAFAPYLEQSRMLQETVRDMQKQLLEQANRKNDRSASDTLLEKMLEGESVRIESIRTQHASELRQIRESNDASMKRLQDLHLEELRTLSKAQEREADLRERSFQDRLDASKTAYEARIDALKGQIAQLERELGASKTEGAELRARKDKSLTDQISDLVATKEALAALGGGTDEEGGGVWERLASTVLESPLAQGIAQRIAEGPPATVQGAPPVVRKRPPQPAPAQQAQEGAANGQPVQPQAPAKPQLPAISKKDLGSAIAFIEQAIRNNTDPSEFARTARALLPGPLLQAVKVQGVDPFLQTATLDPDSPLNTQSGRNFLRRAVKVLTDETVG